ncbi:MAG: DolP-mannose mannosyltransferase [Halobacteriales archaeon]
MSSKPRARLAEWAPRSRRAIEASLRSAGDRIRRRWVATLLAVGLLAHLRVLWPVFRYPRPPITADAAVFEHAGWYITRGGRLYLDVWEPKPPLPYETTAVLALVAGGDASLYHALSVALTVGASIGVMLLLGALTHRITDRPDAALLAGSAVLVLPGYFYLPALGFSAKHVTAFAGLLAVYLALDDRPFPAGVAAAASAGYWQPAVVFPALAAGITLQRGSWRAVVRVCLGGALAAAVMLAPVVYWGAIPAMIAEAVVVPLVVPEPGSLVPRLFVGGRDLKSSVPVLAVGAAAILLALRKPHREAWWWVAAGGAWFGFVAFAVDYDSFPDAIPGLAFVALGIAFLYATHERAATYVAAATALAAAVSVVWLGGFGVLADPLVIPEPPPLSEITPSPIPGDGIVPDVKVLFWRGEIPSTCHYRMSALERRWLEAAGYAKECGRLSEALRMLEVWPF